MKKILIMMLVCSMFFITGCGTDKNIPDEENNQQQSNSNIELYSDNTKIVYDTGAYKLVYYYSGNDITGYEMYYDFGSVELATISKASIEEDLDSSVATVVQNGKYLIVKFHESEYEGLTVEGVRATYAAFEESKK